MQPHFKSLPPLSLYIHIPWCVRKCPYCDFNSHAAGSDLPERAYVDALISDLEQDLPFVQNRTLRSIFFGGGTPSLFSADAIADILNAVNQRIRFAEDIEITLEANPGTFEQEKFSGFRQAGINRLSIGIQSFNDKQLQCLGRIHGGAEAKQAVAMAVNSGFTNFNLDLMHGLPDQQAEDAFNDLEQACHFNPTHISWYQLTIEPNTEFYNKPPTLPDDDILWSIQQQGQEILAQHGYEQYEVSAYSQRGKAARHNLNYWQFGDYLGIGAGAHGKITLMDTQQVVRTRKTRLPKNYLSPGKTFLAGKEIISLSALPGEFFMNALRLNQGFNPELFSAHTGTPLSTVSDKLEKAVASGLLEISDNIRPTERGHLFLNNLLSLFV